MRRISRWLSIGLSISLLVVGAVAIPGVLLAQSAELDAYFTERWYETEVILFQRPQVLEVNTTEALAQRGDRSYPSTMRSFFAETIGAGYRLDAQTLSAPAYPLVAPRVEPVVEIITFDLRRLPPTLPEPGGIAPPAIEPTLEAHPLLEFLSAISAFEKRLWEDSYRWLDGGRLRLGGEVGRIQRRPELELLWHGRWLQPVPERGAPQPLLIQLGRRFGDYYQLEGTLEVTVGRYLHFHPRLWYHEPGLGFAPVYVSRNPDRDASDASSNTIAWQPPRHLVGAYMVLDESRTMRSAELHYLDHPKLGIIIRIDPVEPPTDLLNAFEALQAFREASASEELGQ